MTRFTVVWLPKARDELARIWVHTGDRDAVTAAANRIDRELRDDPQTKGQVVRGDLRKLVLHPLVVLFKIRDQDRLVEVSRLKLRP